MVAHDALVPYDTKDSNFFQVVCNNKPFEPSSDQDLEDDPARQLLNTETGVPNKWVSRTKLSREILACVHIKFSSPILLNGFGLRSANDRNARDPKEFRLFVKAYNGEKPNSEETAQEDPKTETEMTVGFELARRVDKVYFDERWQVKKFIFDQPNVKATEVKILVDQVRDPYFDQGIQIGQVLLYY